MVKKFAWYPADDEKKHYKKSPKVKTAKLRKGITPGSVLVLLAGRFRGRRVVFLKQLPSGLLLVTGPYKVNGVPLKRVNQAYTLTTSTKVDIKGVDASKIEDGLFKKEKKAKKAGEEKFFAESSKVSCQSHLDLCGSLTDCLVEEGGLKGESRGSEVH
jgi:large subunit ribosomal protein L6e